MVRFHHPVHMFNYKLDFMKMIYSKYLEGLSIHDIACYMVLYTEYEDTREEDVEEVIDIMNRLL